MQKDWHRQTETNLQADNTPTSQREKTNNTDTDRHAASHPASQVTHTTGQTQTQTQIQTDRHRLPAIDICHVSLQTKGKRIIKITIMLLSTMVIIGTTRKTAMEENKDGEKIRKRRTK